MGKFTFRKEERLSKEKWIKELFEQGSSFHLYPFKVLYLLHPVKAQPDTQVLFSVSKRLFKKAVDRNAVKRRLREAYRTNKSALDRSEKWLIAYIYIAKEILPGTFLQEKLKGSLIRIGKTGEDKYDKKK